MFSFAILRAIRKPSVPSTTDYARTGVTPGWTKRTYLPGQEWQQEIPKALRASDVVLVCLSKGAINKTGYVQKEIKYALDVAEV